MRRRVIIPTLFPKLPLNTAYPTINSQTKMAMSFNQTLLLHTESHKWYTNKLHIYDSNRVLLIDLFFLYHRSVPTAMPNWARWSPSPALIMPTLWKPLAHSWHSFDCGSNVWLCGRARRQLLPWPLARTYWSRSFPIASHRKIRHVYWPSVAFVSIESSLCRLRITLKIPNFISNKTTSP